MMSHLIHRVTERLEYLFLRIWCLKMLCKMRREGRRVVVITLLEHLGDIVACEPVARYVRSQEPNSFLIWFVSPTYREIVETYASLDRIRTINCITSWSRLRRSVRFDRVVDLHIDGRVCPTCRIPHGNFDGDRSINLSNYFYYGSLLGSFCKAAGLPALDDQPVLHLPKRVKGCVASLRLAEQYLVIHCNSNELCKDWSSQKWNKLLDRLALDDIKVIEVGLQSDLGRSQSEHYIDLCGKLSLLETAEVIRGSKLFVGIDSGPAHIANAVGTYGIILLGQYRAFKRYQPYSGAFAAGSMASVIYSKSHVRDISVSTVYQEISRVLTLSATLSAVASNNKSRANA